jgi:hypothetical protein
MYLVHTCLWTNKQWAYGYDAITKQLTLHDKNYPPCCSQWDIIYGRLTNNGFYMYYNRDTKEVWMLNGITIFDHHLDPIVFYDDENGNLKIKQEIGCSLYLGKLKNTITRFTLTLIDDENSYVLK